MTALAAKIIAARAVGELSRRVGRGGGTSLPGKVLMRLDPHAIGELSARLSQGSALISATNGKTTTAAMAAGVLEGTGIALVHNRAGANMAGGVASTLLQAARPGGKMAGELGLFELDEFWIDRVAPQIRPRAILLSNLFRDQLDRYGELETIADRWARAITLLPAHAQLALNADDPLIADLGRDRPHTSFFGIEDRSMALAEMQHASDSKHCRRCGTAYVYEAVYLGHLGIYRCPNCGARRPDPSISARDIELRGTRSAAFTLVTPEGQTRVELPLPGLYNVYNALGATALCLSLGVSLKAVASGLAGVSAAFGRGETVTIGASELSILLVKNPAGANEILRTLTLEPPGLELLMILNDRVADGRDVSWIWDADYELLAGRVHHVTCSGTRAGELALRLKYAGVAEELISIVPELPQALSAAVDRAGSGRWYALPTYTALLELREELSRRGLVGPFWQAGEPA